MADKNVLDTLLSYEKLSQDYDNHANLLKDRTIILYAATLLENKNLEIVQLCLGIISNFVNNENCHHILIEIFGLFESLESLTISARKYDISISNLASDLTESLRKSAPPAYGTRLRTAARRNNSKTTIMYHLYIPELTAFTKPALNEILIKIKGMISFVVDVERKRSTIRVSPKLSITAISKRILNETGLEILVVYKDKKTGKEKYVNIIQDKSKSFSFDYVSDEEVPQNKQVINKITDSLKSNAGHFFRQATEYLNKSFYW